MLWLYIKYWEEYKKEEKRERKRELSIIEIILLGIKFFSRNGTLVHS